MFEFLFIYFYLSIFNFRSIFLIVQFISKALAEILTPCYPLIFDYPLCCRGRDREWLKRGHTQLARGARVNIGRHSLVARNFIRLQVFMCDSIYDIRDMRYTRYLLSIVRFLFICRAVRAVLAVCALLAMPRPLYMVFNTI